MLKIHLKEKKFLNDLEKVTEYSIELLHESDRGAALLSGAFLENALEVLLAAYFIKGDKLASNAFGNNGPLTSFSSRIEIAYLCGLISKSVWRDLNLIRKIRNEFAHYPLKMSFSNLKIQDYCKAMQVVPIQKKESPKRKFIKTTYALLGFIQGEAARIRHRIPKKELDLNSAAFKALFETAKNEWCAFIEEVKNK